MAATAPILDQTRWVKEFVRADALQRRVLLKQPEFTVAQAVDWLYQAVLTESRVDLDHAEALACAISWIAEETRERRVSAQAHRALGHVLYLRGLYSRALHEYDAAIRGFEKLGDDSEVARTISASLQSLAYLGRYDRAQTAAARAESIFNAAGDTLRLARLKTNLGNIYYRQDRFSEAADLYHEAIEHFRSNGSALDVAVTLRNLAVCYISLTQFERALAVYEQGRRFCEENNFPLLITESDYNIAYVHYLRGEYTRAIEMYEATRVLCERLRDGYHRALCDLDQAEIYLELNLVDEAAELAHSAQARFTELNMNYEAAKAIAFLGIAAGRKGATAEAVRRFNTARKLFVRENNQLWPALIDIYKALAYFEYGHIRKAKLLAESALEAFSAQGVVRKAAICSLLLTKIALRSGEPEEAAELCAAAFKHLENTEAPALIYQAHAIQGEVLEAQGKTCAAVAEYERAERSLETLRSHLGADETRIAFLKDKISVYEGLVSLCLEGDPQQDRAHRAFLYIERAKSRGLADLIRFRLHALPSRAASDSLSRVRDLHGRLTWLQHRQKRDELEGGTKAEHSEALRQQSRDCQTELIQLTSRLSTEDRELASLMSATTVDLASIRESLPQEAKLLEFYSARNVMYACVLGKDDLQVVKLGDWDTMRDHLRFLQFQLSKFRLNKAYLDTYKESLKRATLDHLHSLYEQLIAPVRHLLACKHLIVVPHDFLHYLPFHALWDGSAYLCDTYSISYAPSASVFQLCSVKKASVSDRSLVFGIPDMHAPDIAKEAASVAQAVAPAALFIGEDATEEVLKREAPGSRVIHIATHGFFRQDNPMFSAVRLGRSDLSLFDLYQLDLNADLVTLSGCGTGMNVIVGGDELLGLSRGLLYAGAQTVLASLWEVNDRSTADFMSSFYARLANGEGKAVALQHSMQELRQQYPHPYYWAPFVMIGKPS